MFDVKVSRGDDYETQQEGKVSRLRVVGFFSQQGVEQRFAGGLGVADVWFNRDEDGVNFCELLGIIQAQHPAAV